LLSEPLHGSIYELLERRYDARPVRASSESHRSPRMRAPRAYWTSPGATPLLRVEREAFDANGVPVESACDILRADRSRTLVWSFELPPK